MNTFMKRSAAVCAVTLVMLFAGSGTAEAFRFEYTASQDGFQFKYYIPLLTFGKIDLPGPEAEPQEVKIRFFLIKILSIYLSIASIDTESDQPKLTLHYDIQSNFFQPLKPSGDIPIPFGQAGLRFRLFKKLFFWTRGNDIDGRFVLARRWSAYRFDFDLPDIKGRWGGQWDDLVTRNNNQVDLTIAYNGLTFAEIAVTFGYTPALITKLNYSIEIIPDPVGAPDNTTALDGQIPLPNGSYHFWYNAVD